MLADGIRRSLRGHFRVVACIAEGFTRQKSLRIIFESLCIVR